MGAVFAQARMWIKKGVCFFMLQEISSCDTKNAPRDHTAADNSMKLKESVENWLTIIPAGNIILYK